MGFRAMCIIAAFCGGFWEMVMCVLHVRFPINLLLKVNNTRSRFANVKISGRSDEKVGFRIGFSIESYVKIQNFRSVWTVKLFYGRPFENRHFQ